MAQAAAASTGVIVGRLIADIDELNPGVAVIRKTSGDLGSTAHQTLANASLRLLQDVTLLSQANPTLSAFQRIRLTNDKESFVIRMKDEHSFSVARVLDK